MDFYSDSRHCNLLWLEHLGGLSWGTGVGGADSNTLFTAATASSANFEDFKESIRGNLKCYDISRLAQMGNLSPPTVRNWQCQCAHKMSMVLVSTNSAQTGVVANLRKLGFKRLMKDIPKIKHGGLTVTLWGMPIPRFMNAISYEGIVPREWIEKEWARCNVPFRKKRDFKMKAWEKAPE